MGTLVFAAFGCAQTQEKPDETAPVTTPPPAASTKSEMSEGQIAAIVNAANLAEIELGNLATTNAVSTSVKAFADMMVTDHTTANQTAVELQNTLNITPTESEDSKKLSDSTQDRMTKLRELTGEAFDREFMDAMVDSHETVLEIVDEKLIPNARSPELVQHLRDMRTRVASHLQRAREIKEQAPLAYQKP
jgi:putative membrane protein